MTQTPQKPRLSRRIALAAVITMLVAGAIAAEGLVSRSQSKQQLAQQVNTLAIPTVTLAKLTRGGGQQNLILPGNIQPYAKSMIYARVSGYLKSWEQDIGARVEAGQLLGMIDTPDLDQQLSQAKADLATAAANEQLSAVTEKRYAALIGGQWVSQQMMDEKSGDLAAKKAVVASYQANVRRLEAMEAFKSVVAPFTGIVTQRTTDVGALINAGNTAGQELFEVSDLHRVRIYVQVPQAFSAEVHSGLSATLTLPQYPGRTFDATVVTTSNAINASAHGLLVELQADNPDGVLLGGTYCKVDFQIPGDPNMVLVPATALMAVNGGAQVAVLAANKAVLKPVQLGRDFGDTIEVTAGLGPQDQVIDSPPETLQNGDAVQPAAVTAARQ